MRDHVRVLAILYIVFGALGLLAAMAVLAVFGGVAGLVGYLGQEPDAGIAMSILGVIGFAIVVLLIVLSLPGILAGIGLLKLRPWGRFVAIVLSVLNILNFPFGTAIGVYGLWVLLARETEQLFLQHAA